MGCEQQSSEGAGAQPKTPSESGGASPRTACLGRCGLRGQTELAQEPRGERTFPRKQAQHVPGHHVGQHSMWTGHGLSVLGVGVEEDGVGSVNKQRGQNEPYVPARE